MKSVPNWKRDIKYYIKKAYFDNKHSDVDFILQQVVDFFANKYISKNDEKLINLFLKENVSQADLDKFIEEWDIEAEGGHKALMLSYFMKNHPELNYPVYIEPRLNGILKYYRFRNLNLMSHFKRVCTALKAANIDILIMKGGAFRHYHPEFPRIMSDIDILIPSKDYENAKKIALDFGYKYMECKHSIDLIDPNANINVLDIHHKLDMQSDVVNSFNEDIYKRAHSETVFNVNDIYVPCPEDMMFLLLVNLVKNMTRITSFQSILYSVIDSMYLINLKPDFDWNIVRQNAIKTNTEPQVAVAIEFLNRFVSAKLPEMFTEEFRERSILYLYNEWFIKSLRKRSHSLNFGDIFKNLWHDLIYYFKFRPQYVLYRRKTISKNPKLAKEVLEKQRLIG
ncbi:nucleotidyltransferase family protein [bacterium]|nr:nucleotidyltransferase family protein [bacterium]